MISTDIEFQSLNPLHALNKTQATYISKQSIKAQLICRSSASKQDQRRTANYQPPVWDHPHIKSLTTPYTYQKFGSHLEELKLEAKHCLISEKENIHQLELLDALQQLGLAYHFEKEIEELFNLNYLNEQAIEGQYCLIQTPTYCRMLRLEARNFIHTYEKYEKKNLVFLELAKLDFNLVQSIHQTDLTELSRWWKDLSFKENLPFSRDRLVENFIWAVGIASEPQFSKCRIGLTKFICILSAIDDIYDIYGSLEELELFTEAVNRWDIQEIEKLPKYMKICYLAMFNFANEICYDVLKDQGINILPYLVNEWKSLCKSYLTEARWFHEKYTPTFDEYLECAWISVGGPAALMHSYILQGETISTDLLDRLKEQQEVVYWASLITRLSDDLGTSEAEMMRGDVAKSVQCYMNETGASIEEAKECVKELRKKCWKKLNEECVKSSLSKSIINLALNMARTSQCIYEHVDGTSDGTTTNLAITLLNPME